MRILIAALSVVVVLMALQFVTMAPSSHPIVLAGVMLSDMW
jgi:hypothetical protein